MLLYIYRLCLRIRTAQTMEQRNLTFIYLYIHVIYEVAQTMRDPVERARMADCWVAFAPQLRPSPRGNRI